MPLTLQCVDLTVTLNSGGDFTYVFGSPITQVIATANSPRTAGEAQASGQTQLVSVVCEVTGANEVKGRVYHLTSLTGSTVEPAASKQVTVTLLGISQ